MSVQPSYFRRIYKPISKFVRSAALPFLKLKWEKNPQVKAWKEQGKIQESEYETLLEEWQRWGAVTLRPHKIKQELIAKYQKKYGCDILLETGTYMGDMVFAQLPLFKEIYSVELSEALWQKAKKRFQNEPKVKLLQGDSGKVLHEIVPQLNSSTLFWLDGHYCSGITAKSEIECPIYEELKAIFISPFHHLILIDDARYFVGKRDYPTIAELQDFVTKNGSGYQMSIEDDAIVLQWI